MSEETSPSPNRGLSKKEKRRRKKEKKSSHSRRHRHHYSDSDSSDDRKDRKRRRKVVSSDSEESAPIPKGRKEVLTSPTQTPSSAATLQGLLDNPNQQVVLTGQDLARILAANLDSSSGGEEHTSRTKLWKDFREVVVRHNEGVLDPTPSASYRASSLQNPLLLENYRLPIHPDTKRTLARMQEEVKDPKDPKHGFPLPPLTVGKYVSPPEPFHQKTLEALDLVGFTRPLRENFDFPKDLIRPSVGKEASSVFSEKDLKGQEGELRESIMAWSAIRWTHTTLAKVLDSDLSDEEKWEQVQTLIKEQSELEPVLEERLVGLLTNTVLRRRDTALTGTNAGLLTQENLLEIRSSSLTEPFLYKFPKDLLDSERGLKESRLLVGALTGVAARNKPQGRNYQKQQPSAAAGSAAQAQAQTSAQPSTSITPAQTPAPQGVQGASSGQPWKGGRGRGSFRSKGGFKSRGSFPKGKGRGGFPKGRGKGQGQRR
jgi:hypothetical protein